jgi:DNA-binding NtrC family response regulator
MAEPTLAPNETIRILLLEDNPADAEMCVRKLKSAGLQVEVDVARVAQEFMERAGSRTYDVILSDHRVFRLEWTRCLQVVPVIGIQHAAHCGYGNIRGRTRYRVH